MPNKIKKQLEMLFVLLFFLFLITRVSALDIKVQYGQDFIANGTIPSPFTPHESPSYSICSGVQRSIPVLVTNKAASAAAYKFSLSGEKWAALSGDRLTLKPNQQGILYVKLSPAKTGGNFTLSLNVLNERTKIKLIYLMEIALEECYSVDIELPKEEDKICSCEPETYGFTIRNNGRFIETINITADTAAANWTNLSRSSVTLRPNGYADIELSVNADCDADGNYPIKLSAFLSDYPEIKKDSLLNLGITKKTDCYRATIAAKDISISYSGAIVPIKIENKGIKPATYAVSLEAPDWVRIIPSSLEINPNKKAVLTLTAEPTQEIAAGSYAASIKLSSDGLEYGKTINIKLAKENEFLKKLPYYRYYAYSAIILVIILFLAYKLAKRQINKHKITPEKVKGKIKAFLRFLYPILVIIIIMAIAAFSFIYYGVSEKIKNFAIPYKNNVFLGIKILVVLAVLIILLATRKKIAKAAERKQADKKADKKQEKVKRVKKGIFKKLIFVVFGLIVLAGIAYSFVYYGWYDYAKDFLITYYQYIIAGIATLAVLIVVIRFYKPIIDFFIQKRQ